MKDRCRVCERAIEPVLDLGVTPLANALVRPGAPLEAERRFPLAIARCPGCTLVQITHTVPPDALFTDYVYFSSYSDAMLAHCERAAAAHTARYGLGPESLVVEIASNDGYLLQFFQRAAIPVVGVEPARNIAEVALARGIETIPEFFDRELAAKMVSAGRRADIVLANNVMAHIPAVVDAVRGVGDILKPGGVFVAESPYLIDLVDQLEFDTIYHEHVNYYSLTSWSEVLRRAGLEVIDVEHLPIHGGSLRVTAGHVGAHDPSTAVAELLAREQDWGVGDAQVFRSFRERVAHLRDQLWTELDALRRQGAKMAGYGASAKGTTLLSFLGVGAETLAFVVDRSPHKQGLLTPGSHLPIRPPEALLEERPDVVLLLAWNFAEEILAQQARFREQGGRFLVPLPTPRLI